MLSILLPLFLEKPSVCGSHSPTFEEFSFSVEHRNSVFLSSSFIAGTQEVGNQLKFPTLLCLRCFLADGKPANLTLRPFAFLAGGGSSYSSSAEELEA